MPLIAHIVDSRLSTCHHACICVKAPTMNRVTVVFVGFASSSALIAAALMPRRAKGVRKRCKALHAKLSIFHRIKATIRRMAEPAAKKVGVTPMTKLLPLRFDFPSTTLMILGSGWRRKSRA